MPSFTYYKVEGWLTEDGAFLPSSESKLDLAHPDELEQDITKTASGKALTWFDHEGCLWYKALFEDGYGVEYRLKSVAGLRIYA